MDIKKTALNSLHKKYGAKLVPFAGYEMPIQYSEGIIEEHKTTREKAGIFDVSHMGQLFIKGTNLLAIDKIQSGKYDKIDNPLKNAPHTHVELTSNKWDHKYEREEAAYPLDFLKTNKYWPPVGRVDNVYGDKNLFCTCPSMDEYEDTAA